MKKIMMAAAIVCAAVIAQAGVVKWQSSASGALYHAGGAATLTSANTIYLFDALDATGYTQQGVLDAIADGSMDFSKAVDYATLGDDGKFAAKTFTAVAEKSYSLFGVVVDGDNVFISATKAVVGPASAEGSTTAALALKAPSQGAAKEAGTTFAAGGAGWYATESIPEPTSGLLMLLGMAGLALRRRRA